MQQQQQQQQVLGWEGGNAAAAASGGGGQLRRGMSRQSRDRQVRAHGTPLDIPYSVPPHSFLTA